MVSLVFEEPRCIHAFPFARSLVCTLPAKSNWRRPLESATIFPNTVSKAGRWLKPAETKKRKHFGEGFLAAADFFIMAASIYICTEWPL